MSTGALRGLLIALTVLVGVIVLANAFPDAAVPTAQPKAVASPAAQQPAAQPAAPTSQSTGTAQGGAGGSTEPVTVKGVVVQILNGTNKTGLAADTVDDLEKYGYKINGVGNAARTYQVTTLFFRKDSEQHANVLKRDFFPNARLEPANNNLQPKIQVTVVIGQDAL